MPAPSSSSSTPTRPSCSATAGSRSSTCRARPDQPFAKEGLTLTYNGELYNYRQLRRELETLGATFATASDTEVVLEAWRAWGSRGAGAVPRDVRLRDPRRALG
jgi:asparagine synthetase B (glutamine-hydrolysing)